MFLLPFLHNFAPVSILHHHQQIASTSMTRLKSVCIKVKVVVDKVCYLFSLFKMPRSLTEYLRTSVYHWKQAYRCHKAEKIKIPTKQTRSSPWSTIPVAQVKCTNEREPEVSTTVHFRCCSPSTVASRGLVGKSYQSQFVIFIKLLNAKEFLCCFELLEKVHTSFRPRKVVYVS